MALLAVLLPLASTPARAIEDSREVTENGVTYTIYDSGEVVVEKADPSVTVWDPSNLVAQGYLVSAINHYAFENCT